MLLDVGTSVGGNGDVRDILRRKKTLLEERSELSLDGVISLLVPVDGRVVHLVDDDDKLGDTSRLDKLSVLSSLTSLLESGLELSLSGRNDL